MFNMLHKHQGKLLACLQVALIYKTQHVPCDHTDIMATSTAHNQHSAKFFSMSQQDDGSVALYISPEAAINTNSVYKHLNWPLLQSRFGGIRI